MNRIIAESFIFVCVTKGIFFDQTTRRFQNEKSLNVQRPFFARGGEKTVERSDFERDRTQYNFEVFNLSLTHRLSAL